MADGGMDDVTPPSKGWRAMLGCNSQALALYRISLGVLLLCELLLRFRFLHPFYSDEGTLPLDALKVDGLYKIVCIHCCFGELWMQQLLLGCQVAAAFLFTIGCKTRFMAFISWFLYLSLTLRNTWLNFILDRYFHYLLWYAIFLPPLDACWSVSKNKQHEPESQVPLVSCATIFLKLQVVWIYLDAGSGKLYDPLGGWTWNADPLPALDTYARHTVGARYAYALLTPVGLRLLTPTVVYIELLAAPTALVASYLGSMSLLYTAIVLIWSLHVGIAITLRNTVLLSLVACTVHCVFLPPIVGSALAPQKKSVSTATSTNGLAVPATRSGWMWNIVSCLLLAALVCGSLWFELASAQCNQSMKHIWSTLLHNRWNVFVGAEEYVTWEIAPGLLRNEQVVDVWGKSFEVEWTMPGTGAPCTSTSRPGRWRSFPYLAELEGREGQVLWGYLCKEWNDMVDVTNNPGMELVKYNFFMLQADVLPNMGFSATRKRLIHTHECIKKSNDAEDNTPCNGEAHAADKRGSDEL